MTVGELKAQIELHEKNGSINDDTPIAVYTGSSGYRSAQEITLGRVHLIGRKFNEPIETTFIVETD